MRIEDVEENRLKETYFDISYKLIHVIAVLFSVGVVYMILKTEQSIYLNALSTENILVTIVLLLVVYVVTMITFNIVGLLTLIYINDKNDKKHNEWLETSVKKYIEDLPVQKVEKLNKVKVNGYNEAEVMFVNKGLLREEIAEVRVEEIREPYVTFVENDYNFSEYIKKGTLLEVIVYLPMDYKIN